MDPYDDFVGLQKKLDLLSLLWYYDIMTLLLDVIH